MKHLIPFVFLSAVVMMTSACKEKPESNIIIAKKETQKKIPTGPKKMSDYTMNKTVDWADSRYSIYIQRVADESQPMVKDEQGNEYYDKRKTSVNLPTIPTGKTGLCWVSSSTRRKPTTCFLLPA